ncbi:MAG: ABC transporter permease [Candidatus Palauibacterales bacterium]|nr:ABC transporter permease [Candidatus Palauibacterales bacterium]MDP2528644.1 ABC transporter permease [Candidatus Palauibacterales bacterium]
MNDLKYALRQLRRSPGFALVAILTLALGIGATTAVFSVVDQLLLRPLGYPHPDRIVRLLDVQAGGGRGTISSPDFHDWMAQSSSFQSAALYDEYAPTLSVNGTPRKLPAASVGASYFDVLGVKPEVGRFFLPAEDEGGSSRVVLSWGLWHDGFGADPGVVGRVVDLSGFPYTIVGVAPPMEDPGLSGGHGDAPRLWRSTPRYFGTNGRGGRSFTAIARLKRGVTIGETRSELAAIQARLARRYPEADAGHSATVVSLKDSLVGKVRPMMWLLLAAVGLVLLIACANVANLLLFRASGRAGEIAVRSALGASRGRVVRQLMVENLLLAFLGTAAGLGLAATITRGLVALAAGQLPRIGSVGLDPRMLVVAAAIGGLAVLLFGLLPARRAARVDLRGTLVEGGRGTVASGGRLRAAALGAQVAMAVLVMLGAGVLGRSLLRLRAVDPGVSADRALVLRIDPPSRPYDPSTEAGEAATLRLYERIRDRLRTLPGVRAVGMIDLLPMSGNFDGNGFSIEGRPAPAPGHGLTAETRAVSPGYFDAMGIPLVEGRGMAASDNRTDSSENVLFVNQAFARRHFPDGHVLGARVRVFSPDAPPARVVGVVGDVTQFSLDQPPVPVIYVPQSRAPDWLQDEPWIVLRAAGSDPGALASAARTAIHDLEPNTPIYGVRSMTAVVSATLARPRFRAVLLSAFAFLAFLLAGVGVYGVVAYSVSQRLPELGIRVALGADATDILGFVVGHGLRPVLGGAALGLAAGLMAVRLLGGLVYGVSTLDPSTFAAVPLLLIGAAALAAWIPARRASRVSPMTILRSE